MAKKVTLRGTGLRPIAHELENRGKSYRLVQDVPQEVPNEVADRLEQLPDLKFDIETLEGGNS